MLLTRDELGELRQAAEAAWGDDTRHPSYQGHPLRCLGQCYVTSRWLQSLFGGQVARKEGHYLWIDPTGDIAVDLTGDERHGDQAKTASEAAPALQRSSSHPFFEGAEPVADVAHARADLFARRANRALTALRQGTKLSIDLGDAYPGETPQYTEDHDDLPHDDPHSTPEPRTYNVVYAHGELHLSAEHSHDDLARHALIAPNHTGPFAAGFVTVDPVGQATWQLRSNVSLNALMRVLKDYGKTVGWEWGGLTDVTGQPINDDFAPKRSERLYYAWLPESEHLYMARNVWEIVSQYMRDRESRDSEVLPGTIDVEGDLAKVAHFEDRPYLFESLSQWAEDKGLRLLAGDNVIRRIEDLQQDNLWSPTDNEPEGTEFFNQPHHDERSPGGVFKCPECQRIFPSWHLYIQHRQDEEPVADSAPEADESSFPDLPDMDDPMPAHFTEMEYNNSPTTARVAVIRTSNTEALRAANVDPRYFRSSHDEHWTAYLGGWPVGAAALEGDTLTFIDSSRGYHVTDALLARIQRAHDKLYFHAAYFNRDDGERVSALEVDEDFEVLTRLGFVRTGKTTYRWSAQGDPSAELEAPVPFIYDVDKDKIYTGAPGGRHADIQGKFTPAGIVEGLYEPGGKVVIRSITTMPYTVRHMLELWYYTHPHLVIKSVHLRDDEGKDTKLARSASPELEA